MKTNRWLVAAVIILAIGLVAESAYIFYRTKNAQAYGLYGGAASTPAPTRRAGAATPRVYPGQWNDPFSNSGLALWDPFEEMDQIQNMMNRMFRDSFNRGPKGVGLIRQNMLYEPDLDVQETADAYLIRLDLPGVDKDKISVKIQNNVLTVSGERKSEKEETAQNGGFYRMESSYGSFLRSIPLPPDADSNSMTAESKNGVLTIHLSKIKGVAPVTKSVQVQ